MMMLSPYDMEWMAKEEMKEIEEWILRQTLKKQTQAIGGSVFRLILNWWRRK